MLVALRVSEEGLEKLFVVFCEPAARQRDDNLLGRPLDKLEDAAIINEAEPAACEVDQLELL